jgi:hypothetical protein
MKKDGNVLIVWPKDNSTSFLSKIIEATSNKTVITDNVSKNDIRKMIPIFQTIILMGHGSPNGLFSVGQFGSNTGGYIIDESMVKSLKGKTLITIWCHANQFVTKYGLKGFSTSMFCSEYSECSYVGIKGVKRGMVEESNEAFAFIISKYINGDINIIHEKVTREYGALGEINPVAAYNNERLLLI